MLIDELELFVSLVSEKAAGRFHFQFSKTHFFFFVCFVLFFHLFLLVGG